MTAVAVTADLTDRETAMLLDCLTYYGECNPQGEPGDEFKVLQAKLAGLIYAGTFGLTVTAKVVAQ